LHGDMSNVIKASLTKRHNQIDRVNGEVPFRSSHSQASHLKVLRRLVFSVTQLLCDVFKS
jgi:hypothetical protein